MRHIAAILLVTFLAGPAVGNPVTWGQTKTMYSGERNAENDAIPANPTYGFSYYLGDGVDPVVADRALDILPRSVLKASEAVTLELSPLDPGAYAVCALTRMSPVGVRAMLYEVSLSKSTVAEPLLTIVGLDEGTGTLYEGNDRLLARIANGKVAELEPEAKVNTKILCQLAVWLAESLVCTALSFWNLWAAIVCGLIHAFISMQCE